MGNQSVTIPPIQSEFRAAWVATVDNIDWPSKPGLSVDQLKKETLDILNTCDDLNLNAVIFQVRPSADALYQSDLEPWSYYLTGRQGKAPAGDFDPLTYWITEAHARGIELHVWLNPYRAKHPAQKDEIVSNHIGKTHPQAVPKYGTYLWMDPGDKFVQDRSYDVFLDLVTRYDIDGIHIDDYFYPYPITEGGKKVDFPDSRTYNMYRNNGGKLGKSDWRRKNVDDFIERVHKGIKAKKPWVKFGISPFGIYRPGVPATIKAGIDQYDELYADCLKWYRNRWCDYLTPQLYWPITQTPQAYPTLLKWWSSENPGNMHFWPGNYTSRTNPTGGNWNAKEVVDQIELTRKDSIAGGNVHFSMKALQRNWNNVASTLKKGPYAKRALIPASPWLDAKKPEAPTGTMRWSNSGGVEIEMTTNDNDIRFYVIQSDRMDARVTNAKSVSLPDHPEPKWVAISTVDRAGNRSPVTVLTMKG